MSSINKIRANNEVYDIEDLTAQTLAAELQEKISGLEADISILEKADSSTEKNVDSLSEDITEILKLIDALNTSVSGMQYKFDTITDTLETLQDNDTELTGDIASITSQLSDTSEKVTALETRFDTVTDTLETDVNAIEDKIKSLEDSGYIIEWGSKELNSPGEGEDTKTVALYNVDYEKTYTSVPDIFVTIGKFNSSYMSEYKYLKNIIIGAESYSATSGRIDIINYNDTDINVHVPINYFVIGT